MDWSYVERQLAPLVELNEEPEILGHLEDCRRRIN